MSAPLQQVTTKPSLRDLLLLLKKEVMLEINCHAIATVKEFNSASQMISASVNYQQTFYRIDSQGNNVPSQVDYPILVDCPAIVLGGGNSSLTFPITPGDQCLVLFNDRDMDNWVKNNQIQTTGPCATSRLHSFSDGLILVGLNKLSSYDTTRVVLSKGEAMVGISDTLIKISNDDWTLKVLLQQLIDNVKDLVNATAAITVSSGSFTAPSGGGPVSGTSGAPTNAGAINAAGTALTQTANDIAELLE